jgi:hypothetical protein
VLQKLTDEKKSAMASQYAAEATLRRVHANQNDEDSVPIENAIAPLQAEIKMYRNEVQHTNTTISNKESFARIDQNGIKLCRLTKLTSNLVS